jgi:hypothetical protein
LRDLDLLIGALADYAINEPVLDRNSPRPPPFEIAFERLRFPGSGKRRALTLLDQRVDALKRVALAVLSGGDLPKPGRRRRASRLEEITLLAASRIKLTNSAPQRLGVLQTRQEVQRFLHRVPVGERDHDDGLRRLAA